MGSLSPTIRVVLLFAALANFGGHVRGEDDILRSTAELNRCLTAVRVALSKRGVVRASFAAAALPLELTMRPSSQI
jgi:hypothetical protein